VAIFCAEDALSEQLVEERIEQALRPGEEPRRLLATMTTLFTDPAIPDDVSAAAGTALYRYFA